MHKIGIITELSLSTVNFGNHLQVYALNQYLSTGYLNLQVTIISIEKRPKDIPAYCQWVYSATAEIVAKINNQRRIFICSSIQEGFGLPGLETMACGRALVSTSYEGVLEYPKDGENALLLPVRDSVAMAENVERLFEDDRLCKKLVQNGISTARMREKEIDEIEAILLKM